MEGKELEITASDLESTLITRMTLENADGEGSIAVPARILLDTLKEFSEQPLAFDINNDTLAVVISSEKGKFSIVGQNGIDFPVLPAIKEDKKFSFSLGANVLLGGINKTLFATADDELRPVMGGIFVEVGSDGLNLWHQMPINLSGIREPMQVQRKMHFILPKKPASLLRNILPREEGPVGVEFDDKNAFFTLNEYTVVCRLVEGNYLNYNLGYTIQ
ncbi:MAG: DNA polymerase III subunit beta [Bacteroidales bacterium]